MHCSIQEMNNPAVIFNQLVNPGAPFFLNPQQYPIFQTGQAQHTYFGNIVTSLVVNAAYLTVRTREGLESA
jgi:hypothetical protein